MLPLALVWLLFDGFFIYMMVRTGAIQEMGWILIPFFAIHLIPVWIWLARTLTARKRWANTEYAVTNQRVIIWSGFMAFNYESLYCKDITNVRLHVGIIDRMVHVGDIIFETNATRYSASSSRNVSVNYSFLDIESPREVYVRVQKIVSDIQADVMFPNAYRPEKNVGYETKYQQEDHEQK